MLKTLLNRLKPEYLFDVPISTECPACHRLNAQSLAAVCEQEIREVRCQHCGTGYELSDEEIHATLDLALLSYIWF